VNLLPDTHAKFVIIEWITYYNLCRSAVKFPSSFVKKLRRIDVETRLKGYKYFEIERDFFNKLGVLIDGDFKFGVLLLVFVRFLGGDTGNLYRNVFL
jgi:hypothetical protein